MKKFLVILTLLCLVLLPNNAYAIVTIDENGNVVKEEVKDGEYTILVDPDADGQNQNSTSGIATPEVRKSESDTPVSSDDVTIGFSNQDDIYTTNAQEDAKLYANNAGDTDDTTLMIIISSILGLSLGSIGIYLFIKNRK